MSNCKHIPNYSWIPSCEILNCSSISTLLCLGNTSNETCSTKECKKSKCKRRRCRKGARGFQGFQGLSAAGFQGFQGLSAAGLQGFQGFGLQGFQGNQGNIGFQGLQGFGFQGRQGFQGLIGSQGITGPISVQEQLYIFNTFAAASFNFVPPTNVQSLVVEVWGNGGIGLNIFGGGGGGYVRQTIAAEPLTVAHTTSNTGSTTVTGNISANVITAFNGKNGDIVNVGAGGTGVSTFPAFDVDSNNNPTSSQYLVINGTNAQKNILPFLGTTYGGNGGSSYSGSGGAGSIFVDSSNKTDAQPGETPGGGGGGEVPGTVQNTGLPGTALVIITY